jgi:DNA end-binding protein Ku
MTLRALWRGVLTLESLQVPVKLYTAVSEARRIHFEMLHDADGVKLVQQMVCSKDHKEVPAEHIVRGVQVSRSRYVAVDDELLEQLEPESDREVAISAFVDPQQIDGRLYKRAYYLGPDEGADKAYALLRSGLEKTGSAAICSWTMRRRTYTGAMHVMENVLCLVTLRNPAELVDATVETPRVKLEKRERETAGYLIDAFAEDFDPDKYTDDYQKELRKLIDQKAKGRKVAAKKALPASKTTESGQLLTLLEASLKEARAGKGGGSARRSG